MQAVGRVAATDGDAASVRWRVPGLASRYSFM